MVRHTPGPWTIYDDGPDGSDVILANVDNENWDIAYVSNDVCEARPELERKANSHLIAAAPDLLSALTGLVNIVSDDPDDYPDMAAYLQAKDRERAGSAAIAKAEGRSE